MLDAAELYGILCAGLLTIGGSSTDLLTVDAIAYAPSIRPTLITLQASQTALSNVSVIDNAISFTSPLILSATNAIDLQANCSVNAATAQIQVISDSDCNGEGLLSIRNNSVLYTVQSSSNIAIQAAQFDLNAGAIYAGMGAASLSFSTCTSPSHTIDFGGDGSSTAYPNSLQITELELSHMSCAALTLNSVGIGGHIDVYNTAIADYSLMPTSCVYLIATSIRFLASVNSYFPCLTLDAVNAVLYENSTNIVSGTGQIDFQPAASASCILQPGTNLYSDTYLIFENCTWYVYVGGSTSNATSTWSAVLGIIIRSPIYLIPVPGHNSNLAGSLLINADVTNQGGGSAAANGKFHVANAASITITQPGLAVLSITAADVQIDDTSQAWLNASAVDSAFQLLISTSNSSASSLLIGGLELVQSSNSLATQALVLDAAELYGILCAGLLTIGGSSTDLLTVDAIAYAPSIRPTLITLQASQTALSNVSVIDNAISFTSPLILSATNAIDLQANCSVNAAAAQIQVISDSDCNGEGLLSIRNNSVLYTVQSSSNIAIQAAQFDLNAGAIYAGMGAASLSFSTCTSPSHTIDFGGDGSSTAYPNSLQITELELSHMSCAALTLNSVGIGGHIDVYNTAIADYSLMPTSCVYLIATSIRFLASVNSYFPCLTLDAVNAVLYENSTNIVSGTGQIDFQPAASASCILQPGTNLYSDTYLIFENCTWYVYVGGSTSNATSTWSAVLGIIIRSPIYLIPVPGHNSNLAGSLLINADVTNQGGGSAAANGKFHVANAASITITQPGLAVLSITAADVQIDDTSQAWLNASAVDSAFQLLISTSNSSASSLLIGGLELVQSSNSLATQALVLDAAELYGILCAGLLTIGGSSTDLLTVDAIAYAPSIRPTLITLQASQTALSNVSVIDNAISFTSPLILSATNAIDLQANCSVNAAAAQIQVISDSDCNGEGLLSIRNNSVLYTVQSSSNIAIQAAQFDLNAGAIYAGMGAASLSFSTCTSPSHTIDFGGDGSSTAYPNSLQITELELSHMSCAALTLNSVGIGGHIDVYNTAIADYSLMPTSCVYLIATSIRFLASVNSYFPCLTLDAVNAVLYENSTNIVSGTGQIDFQPAASASCILQPGTNLYSDTYLIFENCTWYVYVGGSTSNATSTWSAVLGIIIRSPIYLIPVPGHNSNLAGSLLINADVTNQGGGSAAANGKFHVANAASITITQPGLAVLSITAADSADR